MYVELDNKTGKGGEMKLKKVHRAFFAAVLTCSLAVSPVYAEPTQDELEDQKEGVQDELGDLQAQLDALVTKASELETELIHTGQEITQAEADLQESEEKKEQQYEAMKLRIKYMYESGGSSAQMEKVLSSGTFSDMLSQAEYAQKVHEYDRAQLQEYADTVAKIEDLQETLEKEMENLKATEKEYEAQQAELNETISSKRDEISNLDVMIQEAARKAEEQRKAAEEAAAVKAAAADKNNNSSNSTTNGGGTNQGSTGGNTGNGTTGNTGGGTAGNTGGGTSGNTGGSSPGYTEPSYDVVTGNAIVDRAYNWVGKAEYSMGACSPGLFDCSGFVAYCLTGQYQRLGNTYTFLGWPQVSSPQSGDVCVNAGHCGIYIGNGQMIHAADYGIGVIIGPVQSGMIYVRY